MSAAEQWIVDTARGLSALERRLNRLAEQGFRIHTVLVRGLPAFAPVFVIVAARVAEAGEDELERSRR